MTIRRKLLRGLTVLLPLFLVAPAQAAGTLSILWDGRISPALLQKFTGVHGVAVTVTAPESPEAALELVQAGGHGMDMVILPAAEVPVWIEAGLLEEARPDLMPAFAAIDPRWIGVPFDPGRHFTAPWQWGSVGMLVDTRAYAGNTDTAALVLAPPVVLSGRINVVPDRDDVMALAIAYAGGSWCTTDGDMLKKVRTTLRNARQHWLSMDYATPDQFARGEVAVSVARSGVAYRARQRNAAVVFGSPKEGAPIWTDSLGILKNTPNAEAARQFMSFVLAPENAALITAASGNANAIRGSEAFLPMDMRTAPELQVPDATRAEGRLLLRCAQEATALYTAIWTELQK
jgi:spermidine/putrescine transport system substrate-binding protein